MPIQLPCQAETNSHGAAAKAKSPSKVPAVFARQAFNPCPRTRYAQDVVIPQVGHGRPNTISNVQGGSPSCRCVPWPQGLGLSIVAKASNASNPAPNVASMSRVRRGNAFLSVLSVFAKWKF